MASATRQSLNTESQGVAVVVLRVTRLNTTRCRRRQCEKGENRPWNWVSLRHDVVNLLSLWFEFRYGNCRALLFDSGIHSCRNTNINTMGVNRTPTFMSILFNVHRFMSIYIQFSSSLFVNISALHRSFAINLCLRRLWVGFSLKTVCGSIQTLKFLKSKL